MHPLWLIGLAWIGLDLFLTWVIYRLGRAFRDHGELPPTFQRG